MQLIYIMFITKHNKTRCFETPPSGVLTCDLTRSINICVAICTMCLLISAIMYFIMYFIMCVNAVHYASHYVCHISLVHYEFAQKCIMNFIMYCIVL